MPDPYNINDWQVSDVMVSYDAACRRILFTQISTGDVFKIVDLDSRWRVLLNRIIYFVRSWF